MKRRELVLGFGSVLAAPIVARAQQAPVPVIGFLHSGSPEPNAKRVAGFRKGLGAAGFVEGRNVAIEFHWAHGDPSRLPALAADLISRKVAVITTPADTSAALVAKSATSTIPIVFAAGGDPVGVGLVASLNHPGGNVTGISILQVELTAKRIDLLRQVVPHASGLSALINPNNRLTAGLLKELERAQSSLGVKIEIARASTDTEIESAFAAVAQTPDRALLSGTDAFFFTRRAEIAGMAARHKLPVVYDNRAYVEAGGLISYGPDAVQAFEQTGAYVARVLKGEKPADLPIQQAAKFETVINMKTAKALGLEIPSKMLFTAEEVIE